MIAFAAMQPVRSSNDNSARTFYLILIGVLLFFNLFLFYYQYKERQANKEKTAHIEQLDAEKLQIEKEYQETILEFESLQSQYTELSDESTKQQELIAKQKADIDKILKKGSLDRSELGKARSLIASLRGQVDNYSIQIQQLQEANVMLSGENVKLKEDVVVQQATNEGLTAEKEELQVIKEELTTELSTTKESKEMLESKIKAAQILIADNMKAKGINYKKNNKVVETDNSKKVDQLEVCFDLMPNLSIEETKQDVFLRLISPDGSTLKLGQAGSGEIELSSTGGSVPYSKQQTFDFNRKAKENYCIYWEQDVDYNPGVYQAIVYHDGRKLAENSFELKKKVF